MSEFATFQELRQFSQNVDRQRMLEKASSSISGKNVFLAHSSEDHRLLPGVIKVIQEHGGRAYVDRLDPTLPDETNRETAEALRRRIEACPRFVMFVTPNSKDSRWVPWELGLADGQKREASVALFPSAETATETRWARQEYLGLYRRIVRGRLKGYRQKVWMVLDHTKNTATELRRWLSMG